MIVLKDTTALQQVFSPPWSTKAESSEVELLRAQCAAMAVQIEHLRELLSTQTQQQNNLQQQLSTLQQRSLQPKKPLIAHVVRDADGKMQDVEIREKPFLYSN
jgi:thioredoxin-like negative regulator of GroEL